MSEGTILSVIIPVYNEEGNLRSLYRSLVEVLRPLDKPYEILLCDDGSQDDSSRIISELAEQDPHVKGVFLRRNFGQTAAITAGVDYAEGEILILLDADQQNDPKDIPNMLKKLEEGYDIVSGWRRQRKDPLFPNVILSRIANKLISWITGVGLHDHGCTLKVYRREILRHVALYGEMHRFISIFAFWQGAKVTEMEVAHHPRKIGASKYSMWKTFKVLLDLPVLVFLGNYLTKPIHFFGAIGLLSTFLGFCCGMLVLYEKITQMDAKAHRNPLLLLAVFFALVGIQIIMIGLTAELMTRVYYESQQKKIYVVHKTVNVDKTALR